MPATLRRLPLNATTGLLVRDAASRDAWEHRYGQQCGRSIPLGYDDGTSCDRPEGHEGVHRGPSPHDAASVVIWRGGGSCAGDPLPVRELHHLDATSPAVPTD